MNNNSINVIIASIIFSIIIALVAYFLLIHFVVEVDLQKNQRELAILDFYEQPHDGDFFIIGSSLVYEGIDAYLIEDYLQKQGINRSVYNLGMSADKPLSRLPELEKLISSKPEVVVIGLNYDDLTNSTNIYDDRLALVSQRISRDEEYQTLLNDTQIKLLKQSPSENLFYNRKFILTSIYHFLRDILFKRENLNRGETFATNFKDPWNLKTNWTESEKIEVGKKYNKNATPVFSDLNPQKKALLYTLNKLQQNNIEVIIVNMPIDPYYSNNINESTRQNFFDFLNTTGVPWFDYEREYPSDFFADTEHMNVAGRTNFSPKVAELLTSFFKKGM